MRPLYDPVTCIYFAQFCASTREIFFLPSIFVFPSQTNTPTMAPKTPTEGTRSSSRRTSTSAPKSPATPTTASPSTKSPKSSSKRVRVVEPEVVAEVAAPVASASKAKKGKRVSIGGAEDEETKDLKNKSLGEIKEIVSAEVPAPLKGALKKPATKEKKSKKEVVSIIEPEVEEVEEVEEEEEGEGEIDFLKGFESDAGADSSDEEMDEGESKVEFDIESLPKLSKEEAGVQKKLEEKAERRRNVSSLALNFTAVEVQGSNGIYWNLITHRLRLVLSTWVEFPTVSTR